MKNLSTSDVETAEVRSYPVNAFTYGHEEKTPAPLILVAPSTPYVLAIMGQALQLLQPHYNSTKRILPFRDAVSNQS